MTVHPTPANLIKGVVRQAWPKRQPRRAKPPKEFPDHVKAIMAKRSGGICELDSCGPVEVYHHRRPRGAGGSSLEWVNRAANGLALSDRCHMKVEGRLTGSSRTVSIMHGWLVSQHSLDIAADVHVLYRGRYVVLRDDGSVRPIGVVSMNQSVCLGCWAVMNPGRAPERITGADEDDCCVCGDPTVSGLTLPAPATVQYPTEDK